MSGLCLCWVKTRRAQTCAKRPQLSSRPFFADPAAAVRLNSIKLSGFKSFAEPTNFLLPGQMVGVVGPNGCGKSNIMDAVRWVLGESRASELRGESMQDVIFNGTTSRRPASRASVELTFDNSDHRAGGQWSQFTEIAVRRVLTREGSSTYYINGQPVRRRDVQDVFLGTGLGPRAYAIIGQGTISRIIESRPEELRLFLEEAAGVSKYKERRRETEHRLGDTRDNLERVHDILGELGTQLQRLEEQAQTAARYQALNDEATLRQHQLWFLKKQDAEGDLASIRTAGLAAVNALEEQMAALRHTEAQTEALRQSHYDAGDAVNRQQQQVYEAAAQVTRLETRIRYVSEGRTRVQQQVQQIESQIAQWAQRHSEARAAIDTLSEDDAAAAEEAAILAQQLEEQQLGLPALEDALHQARSAAQTCQQQAAQVQQRIQVLAAEQRSVQQQIQQHTARLQKLQSQQQDLHATRSSSAGADDEHAAQARYEAAAEAAEAAEAALHDAQQQWPATEEAQRHCQQQLHEHNAHHSDINARLTALQALQEKVQTDGKLAAWLAGHGLDGLPGLWTRIGMEPGWENALEAALRERLLALEISRLDTVRGFVGASGETAPPVRLAFYSRADAPAQARAPAPTVPGDEARLNLPALSGLLRVGDEGLRRLLDGWLSGCYAAATLDEALGHRAQLRPGQTIYVPAGHAVTAQGVSFYAPDSEQAGMLARAQEIDRLDKALRAQQLICEQARIDHDRAQAAAAQASQQLDSLRRQSAQARQQAHEAQVQALRLAQQAQAVREQGLRIAADAQEVQAQLDELHEREAIAQDDFDALDAQLAQAQQAQADAQDAVLLAERRLHDNQQQQHQIERRLQEAGFAQRSVQARRSELQRTLDMAQEQTQRLLHERASVEEEAASLDAAAEESGLQDALQEKAQREAALSDARDAMNALAAQMREMDEQRSRIERALEPLRQRITEFQLKEQAATLGSQQYAQHLAEAGADLERLAQSVADGQVRLHGLQGEIDRLHRDIAALGPVNLAALQELQAARERKTFLDAQVDDLSRAITTLEDAIRKIDAQTRDLLRGAFNTVNGHFGRMFPQLFNGGQARLIMTGEEILDAGVQVMAQPPGKKNQTIHLLSGGEKALTAIALVFAIFQLNPAPFCLLDEVDAPLDDANTERYARLVSSMSAGTQFLFISHNKIAMEMAQQLIGVTMQEQGVSRIVAVDMQAALNMSHNAP